MSLADLARFPMVRAASLAEVCALLAERAARGERTVLLAGGTDFFVEAKGAAPLAAGELPPTVVDVSRLQELRGVCQAADRVAIGARALVLKGVTIGDDAVIQPGSIVTHDVPAGGEVRPRLATVIGHLAPPGALGASVNPGSRPSQPGPRQTEEYRR